jgi:hypothetical protein
MMHCLRSKRTSPAFTATGFSTTCPFGKAWRIRAGHRPGIAESAERLRSVRDRGPTPHTFTLRKAFPPPDLRV